MPDDWSHIFNQVGPYPQSEVHQISPTHMKMIRTVFEIAASHDRNNVNGLAFMDKSRFERESFWKAGFTNQVFRRILRPLGDAIDTAKFSKQDSVWRKQYEVMFVTAAETLYCHRNDYGGKGNVFLMTSIVYDDVRKKIKADFEDRPAFDWVPVRAEEKITGKQKRKLEEFIGWGLLDGVSGMSKRVDLKTQEGYARGVSRRVVVRGERVLRHSTHP